MDEVFNAGRVLARRDVFVLTVAQALRAGWNFCFVGATAMVTDCHTPDALGKAQGANGVLIVGSVAVASFFSGMLPTAAGWQTINWLIFPAVALALIPFLWRTKVALAVRAQSNVA